ncbi:MAG TPA: ABC transporter substrate-binding protein [Acetobacteraceae bacterium]|nr:ABC transporter substrate-binding protein [Acetobacteraceae bacterium]
MRTTLLTALAACAGLAGWANPAGAGTFPATGPVIAMAPAAQVAPDVLLSAATSMVDDDHAQDRNLQTDDPDKFSRSIASILPLFDFRHMTRLAVARNWHLASPAQRNALVAEFRTLLVRTYSAALANYRDHKIEYRPLRMASGATAVTVRSTAQQPGAERMTIDYDMEKTAAGWKVYDIKIAGISLITTYRSTFAQTIRAGDVDALIKSLAARNLLADSGPGSERGIRPYLFMYAVIPSVFRRGR